MPREHAVDSIVIRAPVGVVCEATLDFESYPSWAKAIKKARVRSRDGEGRPASVAFEAAALGRRLHYTLGYDYSGMPDAYSWNLVEGDPRFVDGSYEFGMLGPERTKVTYRLGVDLGIPLPRFLLRRAERLVMSIALKELKSYVES